MRRPIRICSFSVRKQTFQPLLRGVLNDMGPPHPVLTDHLPLREEGKAVHSWQTGMNHCLLKRESGAERQGAVYNGLIHEADSQRHIHSGSEGRRDAGVRVPSPSELRSPGGRSPEIPSGISGTRSYWPPASARLRRGRSQRTSCKQLIFRLPHFFLRAAEKEQTDGALCGGK